MQGNDNNKCTCSYKFLIKKMDVCKEDTASLNSCRGLAKTEQ